MITVGRLDYDSEGLLLMTNSGDIKRKMELPNNNWKRRHVFCGVGFKNYPKWRCR